jgi:hypothetical protein
MTDDAPQILSACDAPEYTKDDLERLGARWLDRIKQSEKREEDWMKDAETAECAYTATAESGIAGGVPEFNILHSNVETIVPSIYNSSPVPEIRPRHNNKDDVGKQVSDIFERTITTLIDDSRLDTEIEFEAQDAFMAGRGIVRVKFDADEEEQDPIAGIDPTTGEIVLIEQAPRIVNERIIYENVSWRDYREGPAKRWSGVPWVAYRHEISEADRHLLEDEGMSKAYGDEDADESLDCTVWEIWCKETRKVYFVVADTARVLAIKDDPLGLSEFFPQPTPVQPITATGRRTPVCPYTIYKKLATELDIATKRINAITKGLKLRGAAALAGEAIEQISQAGDNEIVFLADIQGLGAVGDINKAIMWWPVDKAILVLQQLYVQREQTKQAIYEITGISDIIRGQGAASETATAQQIKTEWGALRVKKMQRMLARQVRDLFVISAEIISQHFSFETLTRMSGIEISTEVQQLLGSPLDHYRIDVESDSTIRANQTRQREEMGQFLQGTAQFFQTMAPIVQQAPQAAGPLAKMYAAFATQYNLGKAAGDALDQFVQMAEQASQQPQSDPEAERMKHEMQMKMEETKGKMMLEVEKLKLQAQNLGLDGQIKQAELALKNRELGRKEDELTLSERKAEVSAIQSAVEMEMEDEQQRAVKIGND